MADDDDERLSSPTWRNPVWWTLQLLCRIAFTVWFGFRARGIERIPSAGGGLVVANHASFLDPLVVGLPLSRPISYVARDSLFRVPVIGWILRHTYVFPINREVVGPGSIKQAVRRMRHGFLVGIFPEGTRTTDGTVGKLKPGFVALVRRAKLPVYPVGVSGTFEAMPRDVWMARPKPVRVVFGEPLTPEELVPYLKRGCEDRLIALIRDRIVRCQQEAEAWRLEHRNEGN